MNDFSFSMPTQVVFGRGVTARTAKEMAKAAGADLYEICPGRALYRCGPELGWTRRAAARWR